MNLLVETVQALAAAGYSWLDVAWVGSQDGRRVVDWLAFAEMAALTDYEPLPDDAVLAWDLVVVGDDWWLERTARGGLERWVYHTRPRQADATQPFDDLRVPCLSPQPMEP